MTPTLADQVDDSGTAEPQSPSIDENDSLPDAPDYSDDHTGVRLPTGGSHDRSWYFGAKVWDPEPGVHENVVYFDLWSLYPNSMRTCNVGPLTMVGQREALDDSEWGEDDCVEVPIDPRPVKRCERHESWQQYANEDGEYKAIRQKDSSGNWQTKWSDEPRTAPCYFLHPDVRESFVADAVGDFMDLKDAYNGTEKYEAIKRVVNSVYGFMGYSTESNSSRLFDWRIAEGVTLVGREIIEWTAKQLLDYFPDECYITHGDTDGIGISFPNHEQTDALQLAKEGADHLNDGRYGEWMAERFGIDPSRVWMEAEREYFAPRVYCHHRKKRYTLHRTWDEGADDDSVKIKGFEATRSDVSNLAEKVQTFLLETLVEPSERERKTVVYEHLRELRERVLDGDVDLEDVGERGGIRQPLDQYGKENHSAHPLYRGAKYADKHIDGEDIGEGSKPMKFPVDRLLDDSLPRTYDADTGEDGSVVDYVSVEDTANLEGKITVDWDVVWQKQCVGIVDAIMDNVGWSVDGAIAGHEDSDLSNWM